MCCIMGFLSDLYSPEQILPYFDRTKSRGPDDTRIERAGKGLLCFHRLAIMGLEETGMQPFRRNGDMCVCNGELYLFRPLKKRMEDDGYVFQSGSDCEIILPLYHEYGLEMFRMLGSGTEAAMCAARVARLKTGKKNLLKMGGAYHGWSDQLAYGIRIPGTKGLQSRGIPKYVFSHTDEFFPGDLEDLEKKLKRNRARGGTAAVYIEPVGPESGTRPVTREFIRGTEELAHRYGALLIFDEVVTGFRIGTGGAQSYFGVDPDLTIFGKVIAGGYPGTGGIGGHADCMQYLGAGIDSSGKKVKKALCGGTMAATPISCCAGYYTLEEIERTGACEKAGRMADRLVAGLQASAAKYGLPFVIFNQGSICHVDTVGTMHFAIDWSKPWTLPTIMKETGRRQKEMEHMGAAYMAEGIVTLAGSRLYTSAAYDEAMIDDVIARFDRVFEKCGRLEE